MRRREFIGACSLPAFSMQAGAPNILLFMTDQESALLPGPAALPNRKRLLDGGAIFTNAFCNTPQCSPARSSLMTGLEPHRSGVLTNVDGASTGKGLKESTPTLAKAAKAAGYATGYFGKWHLGNQKNGLQQFGWDTFEPGSDEDVSAKAAAWIRKQKGPWLAWVSVLNPHEIYSLDQVKIRQGVRPPHSGLKDLESKPAEQREFIDKDQGKAVIHYKPEDWLRYRSYYLDLLEKTDACLGTVLDAVPAAPSIVAYTSDHGDALGEHGLPFKGPFMYEELIRIPMIVKAPGRIRAGEHSELTTQADLPRLIAQLAGLHGLLKPEMTRDAVFLEYYAKQKWVNPIRTIRTRRYKLNWYDRGNRELYDLSKDPHEIHNLANDAAFASVRKDLEDRLNRWRGPMM
jgi:arylsulfatase A-like enzyme